MPNDFQFWKGSAEWFGEEGATDERAKTAIVRKALTEALNAKNLAFLLGAGCSSLVVGGKEVGVPTMGPLAAEFILKKAPKKSDEVLDQADAEWLKERLLVDVQDEVYRTNLERLMELLHAERFIAEKTLDSSEDALPSATSIIGKIQKFIRKKCLLGAFSTGDHQVLDVYQRFFRKLVYRQRSLGRPWIFTTNYDLFIEQALDSLGIVYCNGFSGGLDRRFTPASFRYALAEQLDVSARKWTAIDQFVYLGKLHGSINWYSDSGLGLRNIFEIQQPSVADDGEAMIYPTPMKHHATLASPYSDLFREFQSQIVKEQTVLITLGYSFSDEHINAIVYQALTIPTFRLIVFGKPDQTELVRLIELDDPRIWVIGGEGSGDNPKHYFAPVVGDLFPELPSERIESSIQNVTELIRELRDFSNHTARKDYDTG